MQLFFKRNSFLFFWIIAIAELITQVVDLGLLHFFLKPLLLPCLVIAVLSYQKVSGPGRLLVTGLFFSFLGDVFLLFEEWNPLYFIIGLICFLLTHIFYCWYFIKLRQGGESLLKQRPFLVFVIIIYTGCLLWLLIPTLGDLTIPVIVYACVLTAMLLCSLYTYNSMTTASRKFTVGGTICFVISDSLLAINKFYVPFSYAGFFIMLSYCCAQYLIVKGYIKNNV